jgi:glucose-1-phosphate cytidylyltransferase
VKVVILAGGRGTRMGEITDVRPKPLVEIGGRPILWHVMKIYSSFGFNDFVVCLGYRGYMIKEWFANHAQHTSDVTFDMTTGECIFHRREMEPWRVTLVDTGDATLTGGRLLRAVDYLGNAPFLMTYGDGVGNVDIAALLAYHHAHGRLATVTAVRPPARYGELDLAGDEVQRFKEKPPETSGYVSGGFFVLSPRVLSYIEGDDTAWEEGPLSALALEHQLKAYFHSGFWHAMDTVRDRDTLDGMCFDGSPPWRTWE